MATSLLEAGWWLPCLIGKSSGFLVPEGLARAWRAFRFGCDVGLRPRGEDRGIVIVSDCFIIILMKRVMFILRLWDHRN